MAKVLEWLGTFGKNVHIPWDVGTTTYMSLASTSVLTAILVIFRWVRRPSHMVLAAVFVLTHIVRLVQPALDDKNPRNVPITLATAMASQILLIIMLDVHRTRGQFASTRPVYRCLYMPYPIELAIVAVAGIDAVVAACTDRATTLTVVVFIDAAMLLRLLFLNYQELRKALTAGEPRGIILDEKAQLRIKWQRRGKLGSLLLWSILITLYYVYLGSEVFTPDDTPSPATFALYSVAEILAFAVTMAQANEADKRTKAADRGVRGIVTYLGRAAADDAPTHGRDGANGAAMVAGAAAAAGDGGEHQGLLSGSSDSSYGSTDHNGDAAIHSRSRRHASTGGGGATSGEMPAGGALSHTSVTIGQQHDGNLPRDEDHSTHTDGRDAAACAAPCDTSDGTRRASSSSSDDSAPALGGPPTESSDSSIGSTEADARDRGADAEEIGEIKRQKLRADKQRLSRRKAHAEASAASQEQLTRSLHEENARLSHKIDELQRQLAAARSR